MCFLWQIRLGVRLKELVDKASQLESLRDIFRGENYYLTVRGQEIRVALNENATKIDQLRAYMHVRGGLMEITLS